MSKVHGLAPVFRYSNYAIFTFDYLRCRPAVLEVSLDIASLFSFVFDIYFPPSPSGLRGIPKSDGLATGTDHESEGRSHSVTVPQVLYSIREIAEFPRI